MPAVRACLLLVLLTAASPAAAQWTRVTALPASDIFSVWAGGDTVTAGADTAVYVSTDAGATWKRSARVGPGVTSVQRAVVRNGRLYAATYGQGTFVSDDLGTTWQAFNQGLVGGAFDSQFFIIDLLADGDHLYVATAGAGVYRRDLPVGTWSHFGDVFEPNQASNTNTIAAGGTRLLVGAGANGMVFFRDPGDADWTLSWLDNNGLVPGLSALSAIWTGTRWVVGTNAGVFTSAEGHEPWTFVDPGLGTLFNTAFALRGRVLFASFSNPIQTTFAYSGNDGAAWHELETLGGVFVYRMAMVGTDLYAGRGDGLWRRSIGNVGVPPSPSASLHFGIVGAQPVGNDVRFRFELPAAADVALEVFDAAGRRATDRIAATYGAGPNEIEWDARGLPPGVYAARLSASGRQEIVRLVRLR